MGDEIPEWQTMWGAKVKMPIDFPDDMLKDAILTSQRELNACANFETDGASLLIKLTDLFTPSFMLP